MPDTESVNNHFKVGIEMATLHLMVGLPCSGKTTLAKQLETEYQALRLTPDDWHIRLGHRFGFGMSEAEEAVHNARHEAVESLMWDVAARVLVLGTDVILDFGCWTRREREVFRSRAGSLGAHFKLHYCEGSEEELIDRLRIRNNQKDNETFMIPPEKLKEWFKLFEPPSIDELEK
ncbi:MAG: ATP-binding protein [Alkalibacterium sp.]|nr:ATP-binding protein [Alkalibacterium sp.]